MACATPPAYAKMLLDRGIAEDRDRAAALLDGALDIARAIGMPPSRNARRYAIGRQRLRANTIRRA